MCDFILKKGLPVWRYAQELKAGVVPLIKELKGGKAPDDSWLEGD